MLFQKLRQASREIFLAELEKGLDVNALLAVDGTQMAYTPFMIACLRGDEVLYARMRPAANVYQIDPFTRRTALMCAAFGRNKAILTDLIHAGLDVNAKDYAGDTPLLYLLHPRHEQGPGTDLTRLLIKAGADINLANMDGTTALFRAVLFKDVNYAAYLIKEGADVNHAQEDGRTPLLEAVWQNNPEMVSLLIRNHADLEAREEAGFAGSNLFYPGGTAVMAAVFNHNAEILDLLMQAGARIKTYGDQEETLLNMAIIACQPELVGKLIHYGACPLENDGIYQDAFETLAEMMEKNRKLTDPEQEKQYQQVLACYEQLKQAPVKVRAWKIALPDVSRQKE